MKRIGIFMNWLQKTFKDEDGAVTVDWVVVTAGVVGLALAVATTVGGTAQDHSELIGSTMSSQGLRSY